MKELILNVEGMHCSGCENRMVNALGLIDGVKSVQASHESGKVTVIYENNINEKEVIETITDLGFNVK